MSEPANSASYRILIIDDNAAIHEDFRKILQQTGPSGEKLLDLESELFGSKSSSLPTVEFIVDSAFQGTERLEMVRRARAENRPYALAFVDGRMPPGWDGIETIARLWEVDPELQVVFCTAYADYSWRDIQGVLGGSDNLLILKKPFDTAEVLQLGHTLTRKWDLNREVQGRLKDLDSLVRESLAEKEQAWAFLESAVEHSPSGMVIVDARTGRILRINPAAAGIYGVPETFPAEGDGHEPVFLARSFHPDGTPYAAPDLPLHRATRHGEVVRDEEILIRDAQGRESWIVANAAPVLAPDGSITAGILVFHDITGRKEAERESERMQALLNHSLKMETLGALAGGVAHDFNNLLHVMRGNVELLGRDDTLNAGNGKRVRTMIKSLDRAATLVRQLLLFSRKVEFSKVRIDVNQEMREAVRILKRTIPRMIALEVQLDPAARPIFGDPAQLEQILLNLASNAVDAMPEGGRLTIQTGNVDLDLDFVRFHPGSTVGPHVLLTVSDTGHGMDADVLQHIFDPFFTTKQVGQGTGLGLASVYGVVAAHNGYIQCSSAPGQGAEFRIYLPAVTGITPGREDPEPEPVLKGGQETILVVDDEPEIREMTQEALEDLGYAVFGAGCGEQALETYRQQGRTIDLILLDLNMPGMGGLKCLGELLRFDPAVKVIIASGCAPSVHARETLSAGAKAYLAKPFRLRELAAVIREVLDCGAVEKR
ncbi:MAG: response regulator [Desulfovibrionales bacterium]|nr:MAG: response regulator [Desulfovibrionales bacterium]